MRSSDTSDLASLEHFTFPISGNLSAVSLSCREDAAAPGVGATAHAWRRCVKPGRQDSKPLAALPLRGWGDPQCGPA